MNAGRWKVKPNWSAEQMEVTRRSMAKAEASGNARIGAVERTPAKTKPTMSRFSFFGAQSTGINSHFGLVFIPTVMLWACNSRNTRTVRLYARFLFWQGGIMYNAPL